MFENDRKSSTWSSVIHVDSFAVVEHSKKLVSMFSQQHVLFCAIENLTQSGLPRLRVAMLMACVYIDARLIFPRN